MRATSPVRSQPTVTASYSSPFGRPQANVGVTPVMPSAGDDVVVGQAVAFGVDDDARPAAGDAAAGVAWKSFMNTDDDGRADLLDQLDAIQLGVLDRVGGGRGSGDQGDGSGTNQQMLAHGLVSVGHALIGRYET